jgi:hypothetical protein
MEKLLKALIGPERVDRANEARLAAVLRWLEKQKRPSLAPVVRVLLTRTDTPESLRISAIRFLSAISDNESLQRMEGQIGTAKGKLQQKLLAAIAKDHPTSPAISNWVQTIVQRSDLNVGDANVIARVFLSLAVGSQRKSIFEPGVEAPQDKDARDAAAKQLLIKLATANAHLSYSKDSFDRNANGQVMISIGESSGAYIQINEDILFRGRDIVVHVMRETLTASNMSLFRNLVRFLAVKESDLEASTDQYAAALAVSLDKDSMAQFTNNQSVSATQIVGDMVVLPGAPEHNPIAKWRDSTGHVNTAEIASITHVEKCDFFVKELKKLDFDEE